MVPEEKFYKRRERQRENREREAEAKREADAKNQQAQQRATIPATTRGYSFSNAVERTARRDAQTLLGIVPTPREQWLDAHRGIEMEELPESLRENTVRDIHEEIEPYRPQNNSNVILTNDPTRESALLQDWDIAADLKDREYHVNVNPEVPISLDLPSTPNMMRSAEVHELTHVLNAQKYPSNAPLPKGTTFDAKAGEQRDVFNTESSSYSKKNQGNEKAYLKERDAISERATHLLDSLKQDNFLSEDIRTYIYNRLMYMGYLSHREADSVLNEMTVYLELENVPAQSPTSQEIVRWARERSVERNKTR